MQADHGNWIVECILPGSDVLVVSSAVERRAEIAAILESAGHRVRTDSPDGLVVRSAFSALVLLDDVPPLTVADVVRHYLDHIPREAKVVSRSRAGAGQVVWWTK